MTAFNRRPQIDELLMENSINGGVNVGNAISYELHRRGGVYTLETSGLSFVDER